MYTVRLGLNLGMKGNASLTFPFKTNQHSVLFFEAQFSQSLFKNIFLRKFHSLTTWNFLSLVKYHSFLNLTPGLCLTQRQEKLKLCLLPRKTWYRGKSTQNISWEMRSELASRSQGIWHWNVLYYSWYGSKIKPLPSMTVSFFRL